jgi:hypothetical protein
MYYLQNMLIWTIDLLLLECLHSDSGVGSYTLPLKWASVTLGPERGDVRLIDHMSLLLCRISASITCPCCYAEYQHRSHVPVALQNISIDHMSLLLGRISAESKAKEIWRKNCFHMWTVCLLQTMWRDGVSNGNQSLVSTVSVRRSPPPRGRLYLGPKVWHRMCGVGVWNHCTSSLKLHLSWDSI